MNKSALEQKLVPLVKALNLDWVGIQLFNQGRKTLVRLYVDKPGGITLGECELVSRKVKAYLSVEVPERVDYVLEVSSPGVDRILFNLEQCRAYVGNEISVRLREAIEGRKQYKGCLNEVKGESVVLDSEGKKWTFQFGEILEARVVPVW